MIAERRADMSDGADAVAREIMRKVTEYCKCSRVRPANPAALCFSCAETATRIASAIRRVRWDARREQEACANMLDEAATALLRSLQALQAIAAELRARAEKT